MASVLRVKDIDGNIIDIPAIKGDKGDTYVLTNEDKKEIAGMVDVSGAGHEHSNKDVLDILTPEVMEKFDDTVNKSHTHENKDLLDSLTPDMLGGVKVKNFDNFAFYFVEGYGSDVIGCLDMVAFEQIGEGAAIVDIGIVLEDGTECRTYEMQDQYRFGGTSQFNVFACPVFSSSFGSYPIVRFFDENIMDKPFYSTLINTEYKGVNVYYLGGN